MTTKWKIVPVFIILSLLLVLEMWQKREPGFRPDQIMPVERKEKVVGHSSSNCTDLVLSSRLEALTLPVLQRNETTKLRDGQIKWNVSREPEKTYCVPKKIHFIWLGKQLPFKYTQNILTFIRHNPEYEVSLWTNSSYIKFQQDEELDLNFMKVIIRNLTLELGNFQTAPLMDLDANKGSRADILRYEIIYREGGIYLDTDSISVQPLADDFIRSFMGRSGSPYWNTPNSVFGFPQGSAFLKFTLEALFISLALQPSADIPSKTGPNFFASCAVQYDDPNILFIDSKYLVVPRSNESIIHQTMDATWLKPDPDIETTTATTTTTITSAPVSTSAFDSTSA